MLICVDLFVVGEKGKKCGREKDRQSVRERERERERKEKNTKTQETAAARRRNATHKRS